LFVLAVSITAAWPLSAFAYRPFDGTDADVAEPKQVEIEFQPVGALREGSDKSLVAPATVVNIGFDDRWEAVFEGRGMFPVSPSGPYEITDAGMFLKHVLREGSLQEKSGWSVATEFGVLLPGINADRNVGASLAGIASQRWDWGTIHFNAAVSLTRDQHFDTFTGVILEGPHDWKMRPVAEFFYEEEFGQARTFSGLLGAIWQVKEDLSFDVGLRHAVTNGHAVEEIRAGMTFGFPLRLTKLAGS
jgi:hypothetical protein